MRSRIVVLSDLHLSPEGLFSPFCAGDRLVALLRTVDSPSVTLVLAGDTFDFLQCSDHPGRLVLDPRTPLRFRALLQDLARATWGKELLAALRRILVAGARVVLVPGNHDLELFHPHCRDALLGELSLPANVSLVWHNEVAPWREQIGRWEVLVAHGHRGDPWNEIDPQAIRDTIETGGAPLRLPPGSRLVLKHLNRIKQAVNASSGEARFPFVDLLQPDKAAALALWHLEPRLRRHVPGCLPLLGEVVWRQTARKLSGGPTLAVSGPPAQGLDLTAEEEAGAQDWADERFVEDLGEVLAGVLVSRLTPGERENARGVLQQLERWLADEPGAAPGTLGAGRVPVWGKRLLRRWSCEGGFRDEQAIGERDAAIIAEHLPPGSGSRVVVAGHTHAARALHMMDDRVYLNTGTWSPIMCLPALEDDDAVAEWLSELEAGGVPTELRLRYAEITEEGASLVPWPCGEEEPSGGQTTLSLKQKPVAEPVALDAGAGTVCEVMAGNQPERWRVRAELRRALARMVWEPAELRLVAMDAGLSPGVVFWQGSAEQVWASLLEAAELGGEDGLRRLAAEVTRRCPGNEGLARLLDVCLAEWLG